MHHSLTWSVSNAVFVPEIDDEHREIFGLVAELQKALANKARAAELRDVLQRLVAEAKGHFAHEERLMRASRCPSYQWHQKQHRAAGKRVSQFVARILEGDKDAGAELTEYLSGWLHNHTRLADMMMAAFLRNLHVAKLRIEATTKRAAAVRK